VVEKLGCIDQLVTAQSKLTNAQTAT
jgi:hypothetical protein